VKFLSILVGEIIMTKYLVCSCGWKSKPYPDNAMFAGIGGQLSCPVCTKLKQNRNIEVYGSVEDVQVPDSYNPSKRENKKLKSYEFFCNIIAKHVDAEFCEQCQIGKLASKPKCYWRTATEEKSSEEE
jgi:hypothetical protein